MGRLVLYIRDSLRGGAWCDRGENVSNYGFIALDGDHPADLIQAEHAHCEAQHYLGVSSDDGVEVLAALAADFSTSAANSKVSMIVIAEAV